MKRIIAIGLSILFLQACESTTQVGDYYAYDNPDAWITDSKGCKINRFYVMKAVDAEWSGECVDGYAIGLGAITWVEHDGVTGFYQSCLQPDHPEAYCSMGGGIGQ
ncbi:hypothetical protein EZV61_01910 [Corallincola luteus]|uniref:Lipoprotein n=2 Tax=Corallincola luteus TaxID=1775177 RepID=A0ABY2ANH5_9GAMM|nr:hypothetical protein EZV61_01910 [Corallincola luteus]